MVFSSVTFLFLFLPITLVLYYSSPSYAKNYILLVASLFFYAWGNPGYLALLGVSIGINYLFAMFIHLQYSSVRWRRRLTLSLAVICNLSILFYFKYADFFLTIINQFRAEKLAPLGVVLPIGISFFTFQGMSYVIDVYQKKTEVNKNPYEVALYIALFPQLIAGPIVKYRDVCQQIRSRFINEQKLVSGIGRFTCGLAKKVLLAGTLGQQADLIWSHLNTGIDTPTAWLGLLCYTLQIYFDFSGYSDMAIGLGRLFGFDFLENFNYPYIARTMTEFWRRWHISLSTWFKEYLYIPLGGNRRGSVTLHLFIVFLATGLWHGASWNFVLWGLWNGVFLIVEKPFICRWKRNAQKPKKIGNGILSLLGWGYTMLAVAVGWVLFRSADLKDALTYYKVLLGDATLGAHSFRICYYIDGQLLLTIVIALALATPIVRGIRGKWRTGMLWYIATMSTMLGLFFLSILFLINGTYNPFIYFQF